MEYGEETLLANKKYLSLLAVTYPTIQTASTEIINLRAILNLPKGTEHFISDIHGEYEAFFHVLKNASAAAGDGEHTPVFFHGLVGVGAEVEQHLMELGSAAQHVHPLAIQFCLQTDAGGHHQLNHLDGVPRLPSHDGTDVLLVDGAVSAEHRQPLADIEQMPYVAVPMVFFKGAAGPFGDLRPIQAVLEICPHQEGNVPLTFIQGGDADPREVLEAVLSLPAKYKDVVYLYYYEDYTAPQISRILGKNLNTVYTLLTRSKKILQDKLGGGGDA